jgi:hypothetical protein
MQLHAAVLALVLLTPLAVADVLVLEASLDGAQQVPPVNTNAGGDATVSVDDASGFVFVCGSYTGTAAATTEVQLRAPAAPGQTAGPILDCVHTGGTTGTFEGSGFLGQADLDALLDGRAYVDVQNATFPGGELRGQCLYPLVTFDFVLDGAQQVPPVSTGASGSATVTVDRNVNLVMVSGDYSGMTGNVTGAHLHGPGYVGQNAGIFVSLNHTGGTSGTFSASAFVNDAILYQVLTGFTYVNVHTAAFGAGEVRGQAWEFAPGTTYCKARANSTGSGARIAASGSPRAADNDLMLTCTGLPPNQFAYFLAGQGSGIGGPVGQGTFCLFGAPQARFNTQIQNSGAGGVVQIQVDLANIPLSPPVAAVAQETWNFQCWYRDVNPTATSNLSDALSITFR